MQKRISKYIHENTSNNWEKTQKNENFFRESQSSNEMEQVLVLGTAYLELKQNITSRELK